MTEDKDKKKAKGKSQGIPGFGTVFQRKNDQRWVAKYKVEETGRYKELYAKTQAEAFKKLEQAFYEHKQGILATGPQQTVSQFLTYWLENVHKTRLRATTYRGYKVIVDSHLIPAFGHIKLQKLTAQHVQSIYAQWQREGLSASRVINIHRVFRLALKYAKRIKLIGANICDDVELPRYRRQKEKPTLTPKQARAFLHQLHNHPLEAIVTLALTSGMREGELLALRWQDIDLEKGMIQAYRTLHYWGREGFTEGETKSSDSRRLVIIPMFTVEVLKRHRKMQLEARLAAGSSWQEKDLVFCNEQGNFIIYITLENRFYKLLEAAKLPRMKFHNLRHCTATLLNAMGVDPKTIQEILGHSDPEITMGIYTHSFLSAKLEAMRKFDTLLQPEDEDHINVEN